MGAEIIAIVGGLGSVKGYRQNLRLTDNGTFFNIEFRYPVLQFPDEEMIVQLIPFSPNQVPPSLIIVLTMIFS